MEHEPWQICRPPSTFMRRRNSLWSCPVCGKMWALRVDGDNSGTWKFWVEVNVVVLPRGEC